MAKLKLKYLVLKLDKEIDLNWLRRELNKITKDKITWRDLAEILLRCERFD